MFYAALDVSLRTVAIIDNAGKVKRYRDDLKGASVGDLWTDVNRINPVGRERLGYPTQKPLALMRRIIEASSNAGDLVLDPFCGCGTYKRTFGRHPLRCS